VADRFDVHWRLEPDPSRPDLEAGFRAAIHDPVWFLARQWQMGEYQGENASSPVLVTYRGVHTRLKPPVDDPTADPAIVPAEAIVEAEPDSWWTIGRRVRVGASLGLDPTTVDARYLFADPPPPYGRLVGAIDGLAVWRNPPVGIAAAAFTSAGVPESRPFRWDPAELVYAAEFPLDGQPQEQSLQLPRHRGGRVDWFSADRVSSVVPASPFIASGHTVDGRAYPVAMHYPGAPNSRWWEIEDSAVDIGGYPPDTSHFATTLLIDLISTHGDDWFLFPIGTRVGHVLTLPEATTIVTDAFGRTYDLAPPTDDWWLFRTAGLDPRSLVVWLRALAPVEGQPIEDVLMGIDEYANLLWAVERRIDGREVVPPMRTAEQEAANPTLGLPDPSTPATPTPGYVYVPGRDAAPFWHPYQIEERPDAEGGVRRRFVQRRLADVGRTHPELTAAAEAEVLRVRSATGESAHEIEPATVPSIGIVLERRYHLARDIKGNPVLWSQRQRTPFLRPPSRAMRFDVFAEEP
jgi:hypothetical protein